MDISKKTIEELKVMAYDQIAAKELAQINLQTINAEILKRQDILATKKITDKIKPSSEPNPTAK